MANATVSLGTTTFSNTVEPSDRSVILASTSGITPGVRLFCDRELMAVERLTGIGNEAIVRRGIEGTVTSRHATTSTVYTGRGDQFYASDPVGVPPTTILVYPYINVINGIVWVAQGDESGLGTQGRIWAPITVTMTSGALGSRQIVTTTPS